MKRCQQAKEILPALLKIRYRLSLLFCAAAFGGLLLCANGEAQESVFKIKVLTSRAAKIEGRASTVQQSWKFADSHAAATKLGARIGQVKFADDDGREIDAKRIAASEFQANHAARRISYELNLAPRAVVTEGASVSWLGSERGLLMLYDLLPRVAGAVRIEFEVPEGWKVFSSDAGAESSFVFRENRQVEDAVFYVGKDLRVIEKKFGESILRCVIGGDWAFEDAEVGDVARQMLNEHGRLVGDTGNAGRQDLAVMIVPFEGSVAASRWSAETRGRTISLLMGRHTSRVAGRAQLENVLAHETLHFWIPNGLNLDGNYSWFYEGFTLYQSLRVGLRTGGLKFDEMLDAVGRAIETYEAAERRQGANEKGISLVKASEARWNNAALVYSKALVAACVYDLDVRLKSAGKRSLDDVYKKLLRQHRTGKPRADGTASVIAALDEVSGASDFTQAFITGEANDLSAQLSRFGWQIVRADRSVKVSLKRDLNYKQRRLVKQLSE